MEKEEIPKLKENLIGKKLNSIIYLKIDNKLTNFIKTYVIDEDTTYYERIEKVQLLQFEDSYLIFVDLDCDGYRSGSYFFKNFKTFASAFLDKGNTEDIKIINSKVKDVEFYEQTKSFESYDSDNNFLLIETGEYVIQMGQNNVNDYYPSNFSSVEEVKDLIINKSYTKKN